jgi:alpha-galactosidase
MAWQFDVPETGEGMVQAFRRAESPYCGAQFKLQGLDPTARYALTDLDVHDGARTYTGRELQEQGVAVGITNKPGAVVLTYKKLN